MIVIPERINVYGVKELTKQELIDFANSIIKNKRDNEEKMKMQVDLELHDQTKYMN